eukprot:s663_g8.t1
MDDETLVKEFEQTKHHSHNMWMTPMLASIKRGILPAMTLMVLSGLPVAHAAGDSAATEHDGTFFYAIVVFTLFVLVAERILGHFGGRILIWLQNVLAPTSMPSSMTQSSPTDRTISMSSSSLPQSSLERSPTRSMASAASQTERQANRLWTDEPEQTVPNPLELRNKKLQEELNFAMKEITKIKQNAEKEKGQLMKRIAEMKKEIDVMRARLGEPNAPPMTSEHVPDELFFMPNGECFHQKACGILFLVYLHPRWASQPCGLQAAFPSIFPEHWQQPRRLSAGASRLLSLRPALSQLILAWSEWTNCGISHPAEDDLLKGM